MLRPGAEVLRPGAEVLRPGAEVLRPGLRCRGRGLWSRRRRSFGSPFPWGRPAAGCSWLSAQAGPGEVVGAGSGGPEKAVIPVISESISRWILALREGELREGELWAEEWVEGLWPEEWVEGLWVEEEWPGAAAERPLARVRLDRDGVPGRGWRPPGRGWAGLLWRERTAP